MDRQARLKYEREYALRPGKKEARAKYMRFRRAAYRLANPLKPKQTESEKAAKAKASKASYYLRNKEKHRKDADIWRQKNKKKVAEYSKRYAASNRDIVLKASKKYRLTNKSYYYAKTMERIARKRMAIPKWANQFFMEEAYDLAARRSKLKTGGISKWHVDHIVPLQSPLVCGLHVHNNLQVIPGKENLAKGNRSWPDMP